MCIRDRPHLFDRFYRADKARTHNAVDSENDGAGGYGLGLAIARDIAQAHKGAIAVTSTAQEGTTFTLCACPWYKTPPAP